MTDLHSILPIFYCQCAHTKVQKVYQQPLDDFPYKMYIPIIAHIGFPDFLACQIRIATTTMNTTTMTDTHTAAAIIPLVLKY